MSAGVAAAKGVGTLISAGGANQEANAEAHASDYNAAVNTYKADMALQDAAEKERQQRMFAAQFIGQQRASYGASGVTTQGGSALDVLQESAAKAELDALNIRVSGQRQAWAYKAGAALDVAHAAQSHIQGNYKVLGTLMGGANSMGSNIKDAMDE